ncbi:MAG: carbohydrate binding domain-containing protein, partial [Gorillibacterium sp.]|nr:carbohydrate binding domain-containing protein [Gorillibacterium sp.]
MNLSKSYRKSLIRLLVAVIILPMILMPFPRFDHIVSAETINLVSNGDFESFTGSMPNGWGFNQNVATVVASVDSSVHHSNGHSLRLNGTANTSRGSVYQYMAVEANKSYEISSWVKTDLAAVTSGGGARLRIQMTDSNGNITTADQLPVYVWEQKNLKQDWTYLTGTITPPPGTVRMAVELFLWTGKGSVWYDDLRVEPVNEASVIHVEGITLSPDHGTLDLSQSLQLTPVITPANAMNKNVLWSSSNPSVASVSKLGLVTTLSAGEAVITATTLDGNKEAHFTLTSTNNVNLVSNGDFERFTGSLPDGWTLLQNVATVTAAIDSTVYHSNGHSLRLNGSANTSRGSVYQFMTVEANRAYEISSWVKTDLSAVTKGGGAWLRVQMTDSGGNVTTADQGPVHVWEQANLKQDWTHLTGTITTPPGTVKMAVELFIWTGKGSVWYDELRVEPKEAGSAVFVDGISFSPDSGTLFQGESLQLAPVISPALATNKNVLWSSS